MRLSLAKQLGIGFSVILVLMVGSAAVTYVKLTDINAINRTTVKVTVPAVEYAKDMDAQASQSAAKVREYILALDDDPAMADKAQKAWEVAWEATNADISALRTLVPQLASAADREHLTQVMERYSEIYRGQARCFELRNQRKPESLMESGRYMSREVSSITLPARNTLQAVVKSLESKMKADGEGLSAEVSSTQLALLVTTLLAAIIGCGAAVFISRRIVGNVGSLLRCAKAIASGDLTGKAIETSSRDEIADLTAAVNEMQASLRSLLGSIEHNAENVASASEEISSAATQSAQGIQAQSTQAVQVATAVQEMAASVAEVSENSHRAAEGACQAAETAKEGGKVVDKALETMRAIAASVGATADKIAELGKSSDQIGKIVAVIDDIADQTNLLALNAAIEAARAGEQGRGFAVVADEVRKLAERTTKATKEIAQMIEAVQRETRTAVENMQTGTQQVESGVATTTQAGASLTEIINAAQKVGEMVSQIATASAQQSSATTEIKDRIESIAKITQESSSGAEQSARACQDLSGLALDLQQWVSRFRLDSNRSDEMARGRRANRRQSQLEPIAHQANSQVAAPGYEYEQI